METAAMKDYKLNTGKVDVCWILRTSIMRNLAHLPDTLIDTRGRIEWIYHQCLVDMRGHDWSKLNKIKSWLCWSVFWLLFIAVAVGAGWLQSYGNSL
jgi:hypothetical protein